MPLNIELKARAVDPPEQRRIIRELAGSAGELLIQTDTFFHTPNGRLKLREAAGAPAELIYYQRADDAGPRLSDYRRQTLEDPAEVKAMLTAALGVRGVVRKKRRLFLVGRTRIHLDEVQRLGAFIEIEVVLAPGQQGSEGMQVATDLMQRLGIRGEHLVREAYIDLLERSERPAE
jgi:predicted adenylyl cyclase CyaB